MRDVLSLLEQNLGSAKKTPKGEYLFRCPFCFHHKHKLSINLQARFGAWKCWVCNKAGRKLTSLFHQINAPKEHIQQLRELDPEYTEYHADSAPSEIPRLPEGYKPLFFPENTDIYNRALRYVLRRGLGIYDILKYRLGYVTSGDYANRIIIPSYDKTHSLNFFVSRAIDPRESFTYKNPPFSKDIIVFENMINWQLPVILVEGMFDAMTIKQNVVPLLGKFISNTLLQKLIESRPPIIYVALDKDAQEDASELSHLLESYGLPVKNVVPSGKDANEMGFDAIWNDITSSRTMTFKDLITQKLNI